MSSIYVYAIGWVTEWARRCSYYPKDCVWSTSLSWKNSQKGRLNNKWSKNLDGRSQRHLVTSRGNKWIRLTLTPLDPYEPAPKRHLDRFSRFCVHRSKSSQYFSMGQTIPKIASSPWGIGTPIYTWSRSPNGISIGSAVSAGLMNMTNRQADWPRYSVCNNMPLLQTVAAMRPKN